MKKCPYCGEKIQDSAKKCKHCGEWLKEEKEKKSMKIISSKNRIKYIYIGCFVLIIGILIRGFYYRGYKESNQDTIQNSNRAIDFYNAGIVKEKGKDFQGAIKDYNKAITLDPNYADAYFNRGAVKIYLSQSNEGCTDFRKSYILKHTTAFDTITFLCKKTIDAVLFRNSGLYKMQSENYPGALKDFNKAIELNPAFPDIYVAIGGLKARLEDYEGAIKYYNKAIELDPNYATAYLGRGITKYAIKDYHDAIKDLNKAIELDQENTDIYNIRGDIKYYLKDYQGAIKDFDKVIELNPEDATALTKRGIAKILFNKTYEGCMDLQKALALGNTDLANTIEEYCK